MLQQIDGKVDSYISIRATESCISHRLLANSSLHRAECISQTLASPW